MEKYWLKIKEENAKRLNLLKDRLAVEGYMDGCITVVGSDARLERGIPGKMDGIVYGVISYGLEDVLYEYFSNVEVKGLERISFFNEDYSNPRPGRVLDSFVVSGNTKLLTLARERMVDEWLAKEGRKIKDYVNKKKKEYLRALNGTHKVNSNLTVVHYDLEKGIAYYDKDGKYRRASFKYGPLRALQVALVHSIIKAARTGNPEYIKGMLRYLPRPTVDRLKFLNGEGITNLGEGLIADTTSAYLYFLQLYHVSEALYLNGETETTFDRRVVRQFLQIIERAVKSI